jgi:hypothetical protein
MVNVVAPAAVTVPESVPVLESVSPTGSAPVLTVKV